jgi:hypothetical protein
MDSWLDKIGLTRALSSVATFLGNYFRKDEHVQLANGKILQGTSMLDASTINIASLNKDSGMIQTTPYEVDEVRIGSLGSHLHMATDTHPIYG